MKLQPCIVACALLFACQPEPALPPPTASTTAKDSFVIFPEESMSVLFVIDDSGSMREEQAHLLKNLARFVEVSQSSGSPFRFATVTTNTKGAANQAGDFFLRPTNGSGEAAATRDLKDQDGVIREIPDEFCDEVLARSDGGVLDNESLSLQALFNENNIAGDLDPASPGIQLLDFLGRDPATLFVDADADPLGRPERPTQIITATFTDAVGCILAVGVEGSIFEAGLCKAAAALDADSLASNNAAFFKNADSVLAAIFVSDEDDCTLQNTSGGTVTCSVPEGDEGAPDEAGSLACSQLSSVTICDTGAPGALDLLASTQSLAQAIQAMRREELLFVASIVGPPAAPVLDCEPSPSLVPSCEADGLGSASPGNRYLLFTDEFTNFLDSFSETQKNTPEHLAEGVCQAFDDALIDRLVSTIAVDGNDCFLQAPIADDFDVERDLRVTIDLSDAQLTCDQLAVDTSISGGASGAQDGDPVVFPLNAAQTLCEFRHDPTDQVSFFRLDEVLVDVCAVGAQLSFLDVKPPSFSTITFEYVSSPE